MLRVNEYVFYATGGICKIIDIQETPLDFLEKGQFYYILKPVCDLNTSRTLYVPVNNENLSLRKVITKEEANILVDKIPYIEPFDITDAKTLRLTYIDTMKKYNPEDWIKVIKTVYRRKQEYRNGNKNIRISETERMCGENARRFLYSELSVVLGVEYKMMEEYLTKRAEEQII